MELLKTAYRKIADLKAQLARVEERHSEPVAIVGAACRLPGGAETPEAFWQLLVNGADGTSEIPADRWNIDDYYDPDPDAPNKMYVRRGGFISNFREFDPLFFHVSPLEAASMDPQQRVLLEVAWEAIENAGWAADRMSGTRTGVFIGTSGSDFSVMTLESMRQNVAKAHMATGISPSITAGHLSYFFGLRGPCMALDTACSSALTAIHLACESLRNGEATAALAGSVNLVLSPDGNVIVCKARMLSPDGHCKTFDASADGYARSEGCGVLVLKLLSQAEIDGDRILTVIRGSACNQDGRTNGITAPSGNAQREVIQAAQAAARISPSEIDYVETHGTGTSLGDPIEVQALGEVFGPNRPAGRKVFLGAVKSNIGHLEATAGMAAIIKATMVLQKGEIPPNLHFKEPNPLIPWAKLPFSVPTQRTPWPEGDGPRRAGVSAFGFSGTNVHLVLEEPPEAKPKANTNDREGHLLVLSGQTSKALTDLASRYVDHFEQTPEADLGDVCFTASVGRSHFAQRLAISANTVEEMKAKLAEYLASSDRSEGWHAGSAPNRPPALGLLIDRISLASGRILYATSPAFRAAFNDCAAVAEEVPGIQMLSASLNADALQNDGINKAGALDFAITYAAAMQWIGWGIAPIVIGAFEEGLLAATAAAGAITLRDGLRLAMGKLPPATSVDWSSPQIPVISPLSGLPFTANEFLKIIENRSGGTKGSTDPHWIMTKMNGEGARVVLSLGARSLESSISGSENWNVVAASDNGWPDVLNAIGSLYAKGAAFDWAKFEAPWSRSRVALPNYPFQRQDCWVEVASRKSAAPSSTPSHALLGHRLYAAAFNDSVVFESTFNSDDPALLKDHQFYSIVVVSFSTMLELAFAGGRICLGDQPLIDEIVVEQPLLLPVGQSRRIQTVFVPDDDGSFSFSVVSADSAGLQDGSSWERHCSGRISRRIASKSAAIDLNKLLSEYTDSVDPAFFYDAVSKSGVDYGPSFKLIRSIHRGAPGTLAKLALPPDLARDAQDYEIHPGLLDAAIQAVGLGAAIQTFGVSDEKRDVYMPVGMESFSLRQSGVSEVWCHATVRATGSADPEAFAGDVQLLSPAGEIIGELTGVLFKRSSRKLLARELDERRLDAWLYETQWERLGGPSPIDAIPSQRWLVVARDPVMATRLADHLRGAGARAIVALEGETFRQVDQNSYSLPFNSADSYDRLLQEVNAQSGFDAVACLAGGPLSASSDEAPRLAHDQAAEVLELVQALMRSGNTDLSTLALITRGFKSPSIAEASSLAAGTVWGLGRVLANELPDLHCRLYDIDGGLSAQEAVDRLASELTRPSVENQIAIDRTDTFVQRLVRADTAVAQTGSLKGGTSSSAVQLDIGGRGDIRALRFVSQHALSPPGSGEVQLRVLATAMNFRDVLNVLGMYPGDPGDPGVECVGEVVAVGDGVTGIELGEQVLAIPLRGYCTYANAPANMVFKRPQHLSLAESATLLVAYLTATYALNHLGKMKAGERVLVHAGAGGVGLAAILLSQRAGAEVFATAGSPAKRQYLRDIGVRHVLDSRSIDFVDQIKDITAGEGVDLVLNSLTSPAMTESLKLLRTGGRFLEIGKTNVFSKEEARAINPLASHDVIDLLSPFQDSADLMQKLFDDVGLGLLNGELRPLPYRAFALEDTPQAFRYMSAAKHIGKVVVVDRSAPSYRAIEPSGAYLITGGLGGLGLTYARWLAKEGAGCIILVSRRSPGPDEEEAIKALEAEGATVVVGQADVGDRAQMARLLAETTSPTRLLRGIIHAAGVIDDGAVMSQDLGRFQTVMRPKVDGAWNLHELTLEMPLDFFILFASGAGVFGNPGQSSYAAGNVFLDELARARRSAGLAALSIDWGPWADVGMAARMNKTHEKKWDTLGLRGIKPDEGQTLLQMLLRMNRHDQVAILPIEPAAWQREPNQTNPLLTTLAKRSAKSSSLASTASTDQAAERLRSAEPDRKEAVLIEIVTEMVVDIFALDSSRPLAPDQNLTEVGMDSLMAVQLSKRLKTAFSVAVPATLAFQRPTVQEISQYVLEKMPERPASGSKSADAPMVEPALQIAPAHANAEAMLANLNELADSDVEALLKAMEEEAHTA